MSPRVTKAGYIVLPLTLLRVTKIRGLYTGTWGWTLLTGPSPRDDYITHRPRIMDHGTMTHELVRVHKCRPMSPSEKKMSAIKRTFSTTVIPAGKKKGSIKRTRSIPRALKNKNGVQPQLRSTLRYCTAITLTPASSGAYSHAFRVNDLRDPDYTGVGHQPMGFDQLMAMYSHFYVTASRIRVRSLDDDTSIAIPGMLGITIDESGTAYAGKSINQIMEYRHTQLPWKYVSGGTVLNPETAVSKFNANKWFNVKDIVGQEDKRGSESVSPSQTPYFQVWYGNPQGTAGAHDFFVEIEYDAVFSDPKMMAQS